MGSLCIPLGLDVCIVPRSHDKLTTSIAEVSGESGTSLSSRSNMTGEMEGRRLAWVFRVVRG